MVWISERDERRIPFLVRVEDRDERHLGDVEPLAQEVDADEDVEVTAAERRG
jgi:hypothetical protein